MSIVLKSRTITFILTVVLSVDFKMLLLGWVKVQSCVDVEKGTWTQHWGKPALRLKRNGSHLTPWVLSISKYLIQRQMELEIPISVYQSYLSFVFLTPRSPSLGWPRECSYPQIGRLCSSLWVDTASLLPSRSCWGKPRLLSQSSWARSGSGCDRTANEPRTRCCPECIDCTKTYFCDGNSPKQDKEFLHRSCLYSSVWLKTSKSNPYIYGNQLWVSWLE